MVSVIRPDETPTADTLDDMTRYSKPDQQPFMVVRSAFVDKPVDGGDPIPNGSVIVVVNAPDPGDGLLRRYSFTCDTETVASCADTQAVYDLLRPEVEAAVAAMNHPDRLAVEALLATAVPVQPEVMDPLVVPVEVTVSQREPVHADEVDGKSNEYAGKVVGRESDPAHFALSLALEQHVDTHYGDLDTVELAFKCPRPGSGLDADYVLTVPVADLAGIMDSKALAAFVTPLIRERWPMIGHDVEDDSGNSVAAQFWFIGARTRRGAQPKIQAALDALAGSTFEV